MDRGTGFKKTPSGASLWHRGNFSRKGVTAPRDHQDKMDYSEFTTTKSRRRPWEQAAHCKHKKQTREDVVENMRIIRGCLWYEGTASEPRRLIARNRPSRAWIKTRAASVSKSHCGGKVDRVRRFINTKTIQLKREGDGLTKTTQNDHCRKPPPGNEK